jgi:hypothetical protein
MVHWNDAPNPDFFSANGAPSRSRPPEAEAHRALVGSDLFTRIGGRVAVEMLVDGLYDRIETDPSLRPLFSRGVSGERGVQKRFFREWLGGQGDCSSGAYLPREQ